MVYLWPKLDNDVPVRQEGHYELVVKMYIGEVKTGDCMTLGVMVWVT